jgi:hypothetical protein
MDTEYRHLNSWTQDSVTPLFTGYTFSNGFRTQVHSEVQHTVTKLGTLYKINVNS